MARPRLLDLFCCQGGAQEGYRRAGFEVVGVDVEPQPRYPGAFVLADALAFLDAGGAQGFDAIHASPPCQAFTVYGNNRAHVRDDHPDLIEPVRRRLIATGLPFVIENVPRAPLVEPVQLCGTSFGVRVRRHRLFESNVELVVPACDHGRYFLRFFPGSTNRPNGRTVCNVGEYRVPLRLQRRIMEMPWADLYGLSQAVHPRMADHLGRQLLNPQP